MSKKELAAQLAAAMFRAYISEALVPMLEQSTLVPSKHSDLVDNTLSLVLEDNKQMLFECLDTIINDSKQFAADDTDDDRGSIVEHSASRVREYALHIASEVMLRIAPPSTPSFN